MSAKHDERSVSTVHSGWRPREVTPPLPPTLPCELYDMIADHALQPFDCHGLRHAQLKLRRLDAPTDVDDKQQAHNNLALLDLAHVCHSFRVRTLACLWQTLRLDSVKDIEKYDTFFASLPKAEALSYGRLVHHVDFTWVCKPQQAMNQGLLSTYQFWFQRNYTLAQCAFAKRTERAASALAKNATLPQSWYTWTDGPDGDGDLQHIKRPIDLIRALVRIFKRLTNLTSMTWDASVLPLPPSVAQAIECATGTNFQELTMLNRTLPLRRNNRHKPCLGISSVPGLWSSLKHLRVTDSHEHADDVMTAGLWFWPDDQAPFGIRILPRCMPDDYDAPSARWVIETSLYGACNSLESVTLSSDRLLWPSVFWPLWIRLDVKLDHPEYSLSSVQSGAAESDDTFLYASCQFDALAAVRNAIRRSTNDKVGDWLSPILRQLFTTTQAEEQSTLVYMEPAYEVDFAIDDNDGDVNDGSSDDNESDYFSYQGEDDNKLLAMCVRGMMLQSTLKVIEELQGDDHLRRMVAKCWE